MERLTSNKPVEEMGLYELAHNCCYAKDGLARYRDFEMDMDARDFARNLSVTLANYELPIDDEDFDEEILENLMYDPFSTIGGLIALFYRNLWAMADLREKLKEYEDAEEYKGGWIPCSKKMPKAGTHMDVWISLENEVVTYRARWCLDHFEWENGFAIKETIVAWMPNNVPEPYMEGD